MTCSLTSTPTTCIPRLAMTAAVGKPIYPNPTTTTLCISGIKHHLHDSLACMPIAKWIMRLRHFRIMFGLIEQRKRLRSDPIEIRSHKSGRTGKHAFRTLSGVAHDQHRFSKGRCLLLDSTRVSQNDMRKREETDEVSIFLRSYDFRARMRRQTSFQNIPHIWIKMYW